MLGLIICILFVVYLWYHRFLKKFKKTYYAISYFRKNGSVVFYISFQWLHGMYRDGRKLSKIEALLLPKRITDALMNSYTTEGEAYQAVRSLEAI